MAAFGLRTTNTTVRLNKEQFYELMNTEAIRDHYIQFIGRYPFEADMASGEITYQGLRFYCKELAVKELSAEDLARIFCGNIR